jgi:hypothetical protein
MDKEFRDQFRDQERNAAELWGTAVKLLGALPHNLRLAC